VLEHVANPVAALAEWYRVLRPGGIIYLVVPDRRATWEHARGLTPVDHMLEDHVRGTTACDATHIDEFVFEADWSMFSPETPVDAVRARQEELAKGMHWAVVNGLEVNIHFHTFEPSNLRELLERLTGGTKPSPSIPGGQRGSTPPPVHTFNWEIVDFAGHFPVNTPNGILAVLRVKKNWRARIDAELFRLRRGGNSRAVLRTDAQPFAEWAARTEGLGGVQ
jgi:SAM-dependent methyltransferase